MKLNKTILALTITSSLTLSSCSGGLCRQVSLRQCSDYESRGYSTRIITYEQSLLSRSIDLFLFTHHAQCQVLIDNKWLYVGTFDNELSEHSTFKNIGRVSVVWEPKVYKRSVEAGKYIEYEGD